MRFSFATALTVIGLLTRSGTASADAHVSPSKRGAAHHHAVHRSASRRGDAPLGAERRSHAAGDRPANPAAHRATPTVPPESIGRPNEGHLEGGAHLDTSKPYLRVLPAHASPDDRWGLPVLVDMIDRAARNVARRYPGSTLDVGDISQQRGGDLLRHHSHESGRDADLGFYVFDAKNKQIHGHDFIKFDANLRSEAFPGARFDAPRNWLLVQTMLLDPKAHVSHIFIAEPLRHHLLTYARSVGVVQGLLDRAAMTLMQPTNSMPHDDHMHVRISCPRSMHATCIELAKNAGHGGRVANASASPRRHAHSVVLRTPRHAAAPAKASTPSPMKSGEIVEDLMKTAPADDADADANEVKDALDESGGVRITD